MSLLLSWEMQNRHFLCYRTVKDLLAQELSASPCWSSSFVLYVALHVNAFKLWKQRSFAFQGTFWQTLKRNKLLLIWRASWREVLAQLDKTEKSYHCNNLLFARAMVWNDYQVAAWVFSDNLLLHFRFWHAYLKTEQIDILRISVRENSNFC